MPTAIAALMSRTLRTLRQGLSLSWSTGMGRSSSLCIDVATKAGPGLRGECALFEPDCGASMVRRIRGKRPDGLAGPGAPVAGVWAGAFGEIGETKQEFAAGVGAEAVEVVPLQFEGFGVVAEGELDQGLGHFGWHASGGGGECGAARDSDADVVWGDGDGAVHQRESLGPEGDAVLGVALLEELAGLEGFAGAEPDEGLGVVGSGFESFGGGGEASGKGGFVACESGEDVVADLEVEPGGGVLGVGRRGGAEAQEDGKSGGRVQKLAFHEVSLAAGRGFGRRFRMNRRIR